VREWVGVELVMLFHAAETLALQGLQPFYRENHPRTLLGLGFSIFSLDRLLYFVSISGHPRKRTLKTISGNALRLPQLKSLGNEGIY
jgi:hypothetical protein